MSKQPVSTPVRSPTPEVLGPTGEELVCAYSELRIELVRTLFYVLGNYEDAQDAAQDAFLKCWHNREGVGEVRNLRAWIFRIGINAAKDLQRNAWRRRARPLIGPTTLVETHDPGFPRWLGRFGMAFAPCPRKTQRFQRLPAEMTEEPNG